MPGLLDCLTIGSGTIRRAECRVGLDFILGSGTPVASTLWRRADHDTPSDDRWCGRRACTHGDTTPQAQEACRHGGRPRRDGLVRTGRQRTFWALHGAAPPASRGAARPPESWPECKGDVSPGPSSPWPAGRRLADLDLAEREAAEEGSRQRGPVRPGDGGVECLEQLDRVVEVVHHL